MQLGQNHQFDIFCASGKVQLLLPVSHNKKGSGVCSVSLWGGAEKEGATFYSILIWGWNHGRLSSMGPLSWDPYIPTIYPDVPLKFPGIPSKGLMAHIKSFYSVPVHYITLNPKPKTLPTVLKTACLRSRRSLRPRLKMLRNHWARYERVGIS